MRDYEARSYELLAGPTRQMDEPYKFLAPFTIEDTDIFFGRAEATRALHRFVSERRLTILHAESGAGKTSLLHAGLLPLLIQDRRLPVLIRIYDDPVRAVKRVISPESLGAWPEMLPALPLQAYLGLVCACLGRNTREVVLVLDQFERFFVSWGDRALRGSFVDALADCYEDTRLPLRVVISAASL